MRQIATMKVGQIAAKYGDHAPAAASCCNACRTCVTTNIVGIATAVLGGAGIAVAELGKRVVRR